MTLICVTLLLLLLGGPAGASGGGDSYHRAGDGQHGHVLREAATERQDDQDRVPDHRVQPVERRTPG